ncbi:hypothetical protein DP939_04805 [Spongiactinospora rosea]|uniref:Uncharacterized protein n=1 Tax=Spongiactinospora rosea TaxID=2248750 RepID=A0A366M8E3_9ACTN|nr:hypothetical protein [Spongiactinospora rosea]RBQ21990.1 hypothetical protein DP939_04805 [Spongiactinospora rosea]
MAERMVVFACAGCGAELTAPVSRVELPDHAHQFYQWVLMPALLEPGTYAVDPEPQGPPWRMWDEIGAEEAAARGVYAPVTSLSYGRAGRVAVAPGEVRGTEPILARCDGYCCGHAGGDGVNLACAGCGREVATRVDDCSYWHAVWLEPGAVRRVVLEEPAPAIVGWGDLPCEPAVDLSGRWSPIWEAAAGVALAHLVVASDGGPVRVADGPAARFFQPWLDFLLPRKGAAKVLGVAGPGLGDVEADIALVPRHPQTGRAWGGRPGPAVPLAAGVWRGLAFGGGWPPIPASGRMPDGVLRDEPPARPPWVRFEPDQDLFVHRLARSPRVREPWLWAIYDRVRDRIRWLPVDR